MTNAVKIVATTPTLNMVPKLIEPEAKAVPAAARAKRRRDMGVGPAF